jgi:hypothetical protein
MVGSLRAALAAPGTPAGMRLLTVVGASGSGKSSVVMAGLLPRLRAGAIEGSDRWIYLDPMVPSTHPLETLAVSLAGALPERSLRAIREDLEGDDARGLHLLAASAARQGGARVVLLVDQFEELFTLTESEAERQRFIELLTTAVGEPRGAVIALLTLRADFYDRPMQYAELYQMMRQHEQPVLPMDTEELRAVVERPAALPDVQLRFEEPLVGDLLYEVQGQAGGLPLLQFTLDQLYERREGRRLTIAAYRAIGGVRGALAKHAEATYAGLPTDQHRDMARILFLRLIDPGPTDQGATRRRASLREITLPDPNLARVIWDVANAFIVARLLVASDVGGETALEVSHEALIQQWARLADWLREGREDLRLQLQIGADAHDWAQHGRPADRLYRGTVLAEAEGWMGRATPSVAEAEFIRASVAESQRQTHEELARAAHELELQKRVTRRQRYGLAASGLAIVLAIALVVAQLFSAMNLGAANHTLTREKAALQQANAALKASIPVDVTSMGDSGPGTLRDAISAAPDGAAITFARNLHGTITLTSELEIDHDLTISGPGASQLTISGGDKTRVFYLGGTTSIHITITNLTIAHGHATTDDSHTTPGAGGAIYNDGDSLLLLNVTARDNTADSVGGAFYNTDNLNIVRGDVEGNSAAQDGGGIYNDGSYGAALSLQQTTISGNKAGGNGGGVAQSAPTASLAADNVLYTDAADGSTIAQNTAQGSGNDVYAVAGSVTASGSGSSIDVSAPGDVVCAAKAQCPQGATITK